MWNNRLRHVATGTAVLCLIPAAARAQTAPTDTPVYPAGVAQQIVTALPSDLSPWAMFLHADIVVKVVMVGLALASVFTWTVWIAKGTMLFGATRRLRAAVRGLAGAASLDGAALPSGAAWQRSAPVATLVGAARSEVERSGTLPAEGVKERAAIALSRIEARAARAMGRGTGIVASIGSTAPFVGLFGTVWGIMNSFVGISQAHSSSLAVVAPGIAEALLATAIGLVAAIPAVIIFNGFARAIAGYRVLLGDASAEVLQHLSRDLDRRDVGLFAAMPPLPSRAVE
ncbi:MAG: tonB-system energizer ExbB [Janthinobacterium lividum]